MTTGQQLVCDDTERPEIPVRTRRIACDLFRRHVIERSDQETRTASFARAATGGGPFGSLLDGGGRFVTEFIQNIPGQSYRERTLLRGTAESSYDVDATGMGTATITQGEEGVLLITKAKTVDRLKVAEQFVLIVRSLSERTRSLITTVGTRLSN